MSALYPTAIDQSELRSLEMERSGKKGEGGGKKEEGGEGGRDKAGVGQEGEGGEGEGGEIEGEGEGEEDDSLAQSTEDEVGKLLRSTLRDLESALEESRKLLAERDEEIVHLKTELEQYKVQVAREIANKTKIAKSLDESLTQVREMEEITQQWQLEVQECRHQGERQRTQLSREHSRNKDLQRQLEEVCKSKDREITHLSSQLLETREKMKSGDENSGASEGIDNMTFHFLRQAVFHFLTDIHAEDHLRSISSILQFTPQERKAVYSKYADHVHKR